MGAIFPSGMPIIDFTSAASPDLGRGALAAHGVPNNGWAKSR